MQARGRQIATDFHARQAIDMQALAALPPAEPSLHFRLEPQLLNQLGRQAGLATFGVIVRRVKSYALLRQPLRVDLHLQRINARQDKTAARKLGQVDIGTIAEVQNIGIELNLIPGPYLSTQRHQSAQHAGAQYHLGG